MNGVSYGHRVPGSVTFWGAAHAVTGSMHLVQFGAHRLLLDCGRPHGPRHDPRRRGVDFPFLPAELDAVILSHAHLDHSGNLPYLVRQGFAGPIYCTPPTRELVGLMLGDTADRQGDDARVQRVVDPAKEIDVTGWLSREDVRRAMRLCEPVPYGVAVEVVPGVILRFADAGHLLGSAMVSLTLTGEGSPRRLTFTGDLGRRGLPLLRDPEPVPEADLLICESTYGGRVHPPFASVMKELTEAVKRTAARGGKVLIPAFTLGRTQLVASCLRTAMRAGDCPELPIYVDSPLAADLAEVYRRHPGVLNDETRRRLEAGEDPIDDGIVYTRTPAESDALVEQRGTFIVIAASAMCDGGRILKHIKAHIDDPRCSIVLVSYQAPDSLGRRLLEPRPRVRFHGRDWNLWAEVVDLNGFSGHADRDDFLATLGPLAERTKQVCLVHGEEEQALSLAASLRARGFPEVLFPRPGETVEVV